MLKGKRHVCGFSEVSCCHCRPNRTDYGGLYLVEKNGPENLCLKFWRFCPRVDLSRIATRAYITIYWQNCDVTAGTQYN